MARDAPFLAEFDSWTAHFAAFVADKGKVPPGKYRAYGHQPPSHRWADLKLFWRDRSLRLGMPPDDSSPKEQQEQGLNQDARLFPKRGEGEQLRKD